MGRLRLESRKSFVSLDPATYSSIYKDLKAAFERSDRHRIYYDLDEGEAVNFMKTAFQTVAASEGIPVQVKRVRGKKSLLLVFDEQIDGHRLSAAESKRRILRCLSDAPSPLKKKEILRETGISPSTWNIRIRELVEKGAVVRQGNRRDTTYTLAS